MTAELLLLLAVIMLYTLSTTGYIPYYNDCEEIYLCYYSINMINQRL